MLKNKIKLSLVDDYVKLVIFENFFNSYNSFAGIEVVQKRNQNSQLRKVYDIMFEKLRMNDCSLLLLKQQLKANNNLSYICNKQTEQDIINKIFDSINKIEANLKDKIRLLKIKSGDLAIVMS